MTKREEIFVCRQANSLQKPAFCCGMAQFWPILVSRQWMAGELQSRRLLARDLAVIYSLPQKRTVLNR